MGAPQEEIYFLGRDQVESARLNEQHDFFIKVAGGNALHESIPKDRIHSVADVATGTGVWLRALSNLLEYSPDHPQYYHGFDISDAQFPVDHGSIKYSVHDCLKPFSQEYHNRYDLVHVRLLVSAIQEPDYKIIVANLAALLRPGGYLQWEDIDLDSFMTGVDPKFNDTPCMDILRMCAEVQIKTGLSAHVPHAVYQAAQAAGLANVVQYEYRTSDYPELATVTQNWVLKVFCGMVPRILIRGGKVAPDDEEALKTETDRLLNEVKSTYANGLVPNGMIGMVVARKT